MTMFVITVKKCKIVRRRPCKCNVDENTDMLSVAAVI